MTGTDPVGAVVLAAGFGKRLRPLTDHVPKALAPLFTVPLIDFALARLAALVPRPSCVAVNLHHLPDPLLRHLEDGRRFGLPLHFSLEKPEILGTGGAFRPLEAVLGEAPFFVLNGDVYFEAPLPELSAALGADPRAIGVVGLARDPERPELALVALDPHDGRVRAIGERPAPAPTDATRWIFAGAHLLTAAIFDHLPASGFACVVRDGYLRALAGGRAVRGVPFPEAPWHDLGTVATYLRAHYALFPRLRAVVAGLAGWACHERADGVFVHRAAHIHSSATLRPPVVVAGGARIEARATVGPFAVVGRRAVVRTGVSVMRSVLWDEAEVRRSVDRAVASPHVGILTAEVAAR